MNTINPATAAVTTAGAPGNRAPSLAKLIDAGGDGLTLVNPDNQVRFRVVYWNWKGVLSGVKLYRPAARRTHRAPLM